MYPIKQSTSAQPLMFMMVDSADHIAAKTGLSPTVTISKAGASFASPSGAVSEVGSGWYKVAGNATDSNTLGPLVLHATATGADPSDVCYHVVAYDPQTDIATAVWAVGTRTLTGLDEDTTTLDLDATIRAAVGMASANLDTQLSGIQADTDNMQTRLPAALVSGRMDVSVGAMATDVITNTALAASAVTEIQAGLSSLDAAGVRAAIGMASANLDTQLTTIDDFLDSEIAAIKAKTDNLPAAPAATGGAMTLTNAERVAIADALLNQDMNTGTDSGSTTVRTVRQALRLLRNRWAVAGGTLTVYKEDDSTASWTATITGDAAATPVVESNPAGP